MTAPFRCRPLTAGAALSLFFVLPAAAQTSSNEIVVTPYRTPTELSSTGSAVTVIRREDIEKWGNAPLADILRGTPGLAVSDRGGHGSNSGVSLRGGSVGQTLVLIDGIRAGDPSQISADFDFGHVLPTDVERIEILRGPQSALYGSDAMGGVINIITRKGSGRPKAEAMVEGGSYGTASTKASVSGGTEAVSYSLALTGLHSDGFSRYGYRIGRITSGLTSSLEKDSTDKFAGTGRFSFRPADGVEIETGFASYLSNTHYDDSTADDPLDRQRALVTQGFVKGTVDSFDQRNRTTVTLFAHRTDRRTGSYYAPSMTAYDYRGDRYGAEIQNDTKFGDWGTTTLGVRTETETILNTNEPTPRGSGTKTIDVEASQATNSIFALHRLPIGKALVISLGGRIDAVDTSETFATWRGTAAYTIEETGTKLRASLGTGAKAPSLYQLYNPYRPDTSGPTALRPETSIGGDVGIDQKLPAGLGTASASVFFNRYKDLIGWRDLQYSPTYQGEYYNVNRAETKGVETSVDLGLLPGLFRAKGTYTFLLAEDLDKGKALLLRPQHQGSIGLVYTGIRDLEVETRVTMVGHRMDYVSSTEDVRLAPYARLDVFANYRVNDTFSVFARAENLTDAHYETVRNYGTPGRSAYAGIRAKW